MTTSSSHSWVGPAWAALLLACLLAVALPARAQTVFVVQGERGAQGTAGGPSPLICGFESCTLDRPLSVGGDFSATGQATCDDLALTGDAQLDQLTADDLTVTSTVWWPACPEGYERDETRTDIVLCVNGFDEMVQVGDIWVDRYEASVWGG